jgi:hypothetical protein
MQLLEAPSDEFLQLFKVVRQLLEAFGQGFAVEV